MTQISSRVMQRHGALADWTSNNIVLLDGELAVVDCGGFTRFKVGNGLSTFNQLPFTDQEQISTKLVTANSISQGIHAQSTPYGLAAGAFLSAGANFSQALGYNTAILSTDTYAFAWNGDDTAAIGNYYSSHGKGTFNVNPKDGISGFYIGEQNVSELIDSSRATIQQLSGDPYKADLSVIKISDVDYHQKTIDGQLLSNAIYIVESNCINAYGQQVKNVAPATDLSDAVNLEQLSDAVNGIQMPTDLSDFANSPGYITKASADVDYQPVGNYLSSNALADYKTYAQTKSSLSNDGYLTAHQSLSNYYQKSETSSAAEISTALSVKADLSSIEHVVQYEQDCNGNYTAATIGSRSSGLIADIGENSLVNGYNCQANGSGSHAEGGGTYAGNYYAHAEGYSTIADNEGTHAEGGYTSAFGYYSHTEGGWTRTGEYAVGAHAEGGFGRADGPISHIDGVRAVAEVSDYMSYVWQGSDVPLPDNVYDIDLDDYPEYKAHGPGTFNINPVSGAAGVYIGEQTLASMLVDVSSTISGELRKYQLSGNYLSASFADTVYTKSETSSAVEIQTAVSTQNGLLEELSTTVGELGSSVLDIQSQISTIAPSSFQHIPYPDASVRSLQQTLSAILAVLKRESIGQ